MRTPGSAEELERVRMIAVNMFELGKTPAEIAACLGVHPQTVRDWRRVWLARGLDGLRLKPHPGRPCELDADQKRQLVGLLQRPPVEHGFDRHLWTTPMIARL